MNRILEIAREVEQPHKKHLANQVIAWSRYERTALFLLYGAMCAVCGGVLFSVLDRPVRSWLGW